MSTVALCSAACAKVEAPPGGPPDSTPPAIIVVQPESGSVVPALHGAAVIRFDEVIDEQAGAGGGGGPAGLGRLVLLSPVAGDVTVSWHRTAIEVKPKEGWQPGRVYRLELLPGIVDLRRNRLRTGRTIIFSTGPALPTASLAGTVLKWIEQRALVRALVLAAPLPDTIPYVAVADSAGKFTLAGVPPGEYVVYGINDENGNRRRDRREAYDSVRVRVDDSTSVVLWTFVHDTVGPRPRIAESLDSVTLRLSFTQPLDPARAVDTSQVALLALPDSLPVPLTAVLTAAAYDSLLARQRAAQDSARQAHDTTEARPPSEGARRAAARGAPRPSAAADSASLTNLRRLLATRPVPTDRMILRTAQPLQPGARYVIRVRDATNLSGAIGTGQVLLVAPQRAAADTAAAARP